MSHEAAQARLHRIRSFGAGLAAHPLTEIELTGY
jgi:hypothetical protein